MTAPRTSQLREAGVLAGAAGTQLTDSGRDWLEALEDAQSTGRAQNEDPAELVLSTSGLVR
jgi:hypothetical protein